MRLLFALLIPLALTACKYDETVSGYTDTGATWVLVELDGKPFIGRATITFPAKGRVAGEAACNRYSGKQTAPLPWFKIEDMQATLMACNDSTGERAFLSALEEMSLAETHGGTLILSNDNGREMVFKSNP